MIASEVILPLISTVLVLSIYSFLYKDNPMFRIATNVFIGGVCAYGMVINTKRLYEHIVIPILEGKYWVLITLVGCILMFARFLKGREWLIRLPMAALIGAGIGLNVAAGVQAQILAQVIDTMKPITSINNIIIILGVCTVTLFFFYSKETTGAMGSVNQIGRSFLMVALGASFAYEFLGRTSQLLSRFKVLINFPNYLLVILALIIILYDAVIRKK